MSTEITKVIAMKAIDDEIGRRRNNKTREQKKRPKAWYLAKLTRPDFAVLKAGGTVTVVGKKSGRVVHLKAS